jgi:phospholipid/cholesterol/gamma-HCH transport system permease protein
MLTKFHPVTWFLVLCQHIGAMITGTCAMVGKISMFVFDTLRHAVTPPWYPQKILAQFVSIGFFSLAVVGMTALFSGMVIALQSYTGFSRFNAESAVANVVVLTITRELAPVLAGLMLAARVGASIAAEIGTMRVTEQIDALRTLNVNPMKYLVVPRVLAGFVMLPILVFIADIIGVMGGWLVGVYVLDFSSASYIKQTLDFVTWADVNSGLIKAAVFGLIVTLMGCYNGYHSGRGAQGVGRATTNAVVSSAILILIFNYILTQILFS